jgi:hypothetical protein
LKRLERRAGRRNIERLDEGALHQIVARNADLRMPRDVV